MKLSRLAPPKGAHKKHKRVGRGESSGHGKTCCRGGKGQKGRKGVSIRAGFEGGQKPLYRRFPKLGFTSRQRATGKNYFVAVNLSDVAAITNEAIISPVLLGAKNGQSIKLLATGKLDRAVTVQVHAASAAARSAVEKAGGTVEILAA